MNLCSTMFSACSSASYSFGVSMAWKWFFLHNKIRKHHVQCLQFGLVPLRSVHSLIIFFLKKILKSPCPSIFTMSSHYIDDLGNVHSLIIIVFFYINNSQKSIFTHSLSHTHTCTHLGARTANLHLHLYLYLYIEYTKTHSYTHLGASTTHFHLLLHCCCVIDLNFFWKKNW